MNKKYAFFGAILTIAVIILGMGTGVQAAVTAATDDTQQLEARLKPVASTLKNINIKSSTPSVNKIKLYQVQGYCIFVKDGHVIAAFEC